MAIFNSRHDEIPVRTMGKDSLSIAASWNFLACLKGPAGIAIGLLVISGAFHFAVLWLTQAEWEGPLSPRKPALFGVSTGLTLLSLAWVQTNCPPRRGDRWLMNLLSFALVAEVGLITLQYWRGQPSHFHHGTKFDTGVELTMLGLILLGTIAIVDLTIRCVRSPWPDSTMWLAACCGMTFLAISCGIGILISLLGGFNHAMGKPPELWGRAGVLKYPHGATLHAIQLLPGMVWLGRRIGVTALRRAVVMMTASQSLFLAQALWQTFHGRGRLEMDAVGIIFIGLAGLFAVIPALQFGWTLLRNFTASSHVNQRDTGGS